MINYIENWKNEEVKMYMEYVRYCNTMIKKWESEYGFFEMITMMSYKKIPEKTKQFTKFTDERLKVEARKIIDKHFEGLQKKVEIKMGKIVSIQTIGDNGMDYLFTCENGNCQIKVVIAGGHTVQRQHTRWIINKVK